MANKRNAPRPDNRGTLQEKNGTAPKATRCREIETVDVYLVLGPCDRCEQCGKPGTWEISHDQICPWLLGRLRRELAEALAGVAA